MKTIGNGEMLYDALPKKLNTNNISVKIIGNVLHFLYLVGKVAVAVRPRIVLTPSFSFKTCNYN